MLFIYFWNFIYEPIKNRLKTAKDMPTWKLKMANHTQIKTYQIISFRPQILETMKNYMKYQMITWKKSQILQIKMQKFY